MVRTIRKEGGGYLLELNRLEGEDNQMNDSCPHPDLQPILDHNQAVFNMPKGLPPIRGHEHSIILKEGSDPISVRPYRYP